MLRTGICLLSLLILPNLRSPQMTNALMKPYTNQRRLKATKPLTDVLTAQRNLKANVDCHLSHRRVMLDLLVKTAFGVASTSITFPKESLAATNDRDFDVEDFLKSGQVAQPMGVSGQAGKSRPETGVVLRDGSDVSRDPRTGDVLAEIVVESNQRKGKTSVLASYSSPWPLGTLIPNLCVCKFLIYWWLATSYFRILFSMIIFINQLTISHFSEKAKGTVFDVECRDANTGDGIFLAVTPSKYEGGVGVSTINQLPDSFILDQLIKPDGRLSFYGPPTNVKIISSTVVGDYKFIDLSYSVVSQATQTEIPRRAKIAVTIPSGTDQAVLVMGSASVGRWKRGSQALVSSAVQSFRAVQAPPSALKIRGKPRM
jgi:hypothetical protein